MKIKIDKIFIFKILILLILINYQIVTIIFNDFIILKYLRDIILVCLLVGCVFLKSGYKLKIRELWLVIIILFVLMATVKAINIPIGIISLRKYIFPLGIFVVVSRMNWNDIKNRTRIVDFLIVVITLLSIWGIFQAWILGDSFLKKLGYYTAYSYWYGRVMLRNSFYFGGLGIQRVVATLSNSNECALVLGVCLIFLIANYNIIHKKYKDLYMVLILLAYLLTFSRSNFISLFIVVIMIIHPYIPYKKNIVIMLFATIIGSAILYFMSEDEGVIVNIINWVGETINFTDASVAGRSNIWANAFKEVINNPLGIGFGYVGSIARDAGYTYFACENSYLAMALEFGILGMLVYLAFMINLVRTLKYWKHCFELEGDLNKSRLCACSEAILIYYMVAMFFSNYIHNLEAMAIMYLCVGIAFGVINDYRSNYSKI